MSVKIACKYLGNKRVEMTHLDSGASIVSTAPKDNQGDGQGFSPTDLTAGALGACMLTIMGIMADRNGIDIGGAHAEVEKHMTDNPRRIGAVGLRIHLPACLGEADRRRLENAASACPVHHSLDSAIAAEPEFVYDM